jgi:uncharacterized membrane protein YraQ (UPF0718 family)/copper chaperone CopZ
MNAIRTYLIETWSLIAEMGPYLLLGFLIAGLLHKWIRQQWIEQHLGQPGFKSIVLASIFGVPMPLCSCGVIPVTASLREKGATKGAATSFLTSTPQTGIDSILATYGMLGPVFALYRVVVAFVSGIGVGLIVELFSKKNEVATPRSSATESAKPTWVESARYGMITLPGDIAVSLFVGFLLAGLISAAAPDDLLANLPGGVYTSILLTTAIATPFYICSTGSIPLALALIDSGLPVSAALVLLIAGPTTNIATITTMRKTLGGRETTIYVTMIILVSWTAALIFHEFLGTTVFEHGHVHLSGLSLWSHVTGATLIAMLAYSYWRKGNTGKSALQEISDPWNDPQIASFKIKGMTCSHCRKSAIKGLSSLPGVNRVSVDLNSGKASIGGSSINSENVSAKLDSLGFTLASFSIQAKTQ